MTRRYWQDFETGRRGFTEKNGDLPDGPLVEEIAPCEFYQRETQDISDELGSDNALHLAKEGFVHATTTRLLLTDKGVAAMSADDEALQ